ncbi:MAG: 4Fe-4S dicluster domain-containing protein [Clostridia bacterium]|nr:4Fe-4S dicluster domain-containing protein [Clostridia bacterium]
MYRISEKDLDKLFSKINQDRKLYIPSDTSAGVAQFMPWKEGMKLTSALNTVRSAKDFFFPQTENLVDFKVDGKNIEVIDAREETEDFVIFGVRACDVRSFSILDKVFLCEPVDSYYKNRREHGTIISLACNMPEETCFCSAFGIDCAEPKGDIEAYSFGEYYYFNPVTEKGTKLVASLSDILSECGDEDVLICKKAINVIKSKLPLAKLSTEDFGGDKMNEMFSSEKWAELSESCIGCGTCTFVCPTCQCYDIRDFDTGNGIKRFRCWDSCMYSDFTKMAHGNPRVSQLERFRQRFMHKLVYFPSNNNGEFGCVGCGRCLSKCPVSMNIVKVMKSFSEGEK